MRYKALQEVFFLERLFNKYFTVYTATQSRRRREMQTASVGRGHSSYEIFVMKMERRASVIQSLILEQPLKQWEDCKRNDKVITNQ